MQPLKPLQKNYFYEDWEEVVLSVRSAGEVLTMPPGPEELQRARGRWASLLSQGALFKRTRWINWRVPPDPLPCATVELRELGELVDRLLQGVNRGLDSSPSVRKALGFPACPEEALLLECQREEPLRFFRLDLTLNQDGHLKLFEIQVVVGGLGITQALREAYGPHGDLPGIAPAYEESIVSGFRHWCGARGMNPSPCPLIAVLGARNSAYRHDHLVLARWLKGCQMAVSPLVFLKWDLQGRPTLPDCRNAQIIHRLFRSPCLFRTSPRRGNALLEAIRESRTYVVNPWKDVLEDKRILALVHDPDAPRVLPGCLSSREWKRLRGVVPPTRNASPEAIADLLDRPRSERAFYLKKGRSFESRQLCDGQQVSLRQWHAACMRARQEGDWIVQEAIRGEPWNFRYLDFQTQEIREMRGHVRISPFYFRGSDGEIRLGDVLITAREERSRIHGASDAVLGVPGGRP